MSDVTPTETTPPADNHQLLGYWQQATGSKDPNLVEEHAKPKRPVLLADPEYDLRGVAWNPLCDAATPLIGLVIRLRRLDHHDDVPALYLSVSNQITTIMEEVSQLDYDAGMLKAYSYSLCLLIDEVVMRTTWGRLSSWSARSLLSQFHGETQGGEKFFTVMNNMIPEAARYQHVLEFMYQCLISGLKGKYGAHIKGDDEIQKIIDQLHGLLRPLRGETPKRLTDPLKNVAPRNYRIKRAWPLWTPWAMAAVVLTVAYTIYSIRLNAITQQVLVSLERVLHL
ncbi:type IVB secretion system protein IcmH/DotU [Pseudomonas khavaziana]|uniref:type IVB secretion system protein IcmH/DotU n=1 Tax=Pseudomonas khavaziana TaxID=2842351 RepID=UPI001C3C3F86|nr:type IVB secretion system protein IcmH/DotU [Pseudomonas khavaziana]MBV4481527.1 type IVB secretion system protein IcmH/DotU [Pseudomonas khavaziana]